MTPPLTPPHTHTLTHPLFLALTQVRLWEEVFGVHEAIELTAEDMPLPPKAKVLQQR